MGSRCRAKEVDTELPMAVSLGNHRRNLKDGDNVIVSIAARIPTSSVAALSAAVASAFSDGAAMANLIELRDLAKIYQSGDSSSHPAT